MSEMRSGSDGPSIPKFYEGRSIFITGATGFVGKVLIERLLSTCPGIKKIFLLLRGKNDLSPEKRLVQLKASPVYDILRSRDPEQLDKLEFVAGDVTQIDLGISPQDLMRLTEVSILFHSAATVKFHEPLRVAVEQNLLSVVRVMDVCDQLPALQVAVQVSTAFSNSERRRVEERVYPTPVLLSHALNVLYSNSDDQLERITREFISPKANTYTFTKAMAESVFAERANRGYSIAIFRPSIVICTLRDPFPGWQEHLQGPGLAIAAAGVGMMRASNTDPCMRADMIPADMCADGLLAVAWEAGIDRKKEVKVYNCTSVENIKTWGHFGDVINKTFKEFPFDQTVWYPHVILRSSYKFIILDFLTQRLPLYSVQYLTQILGIKTNMNLIKCYKKLSKLNEVLSYFSTNEWHFDCDNMRRLRHRLSAEDRKIFNLDPRNIDWNELISNFVKGTKKYILSEKDEDLPKARTRLER